MNGSIPRPSKRRTSLALRPAVRHNSPRLTPATIPDPTPSARKAGTSPNKCASSATTPPAPPPYAPPPNNHAFAGRQRPAFTLRSFPNYQHDHSRSESLFLGHPNVGTSGEESTLTSLSTPLAPEPLN